MTTTTEQKTCAQRIDQELAGLEESTGQLIEALNSGSDEGWSEWHEYALSIDTRKITKILFSWGGPSDFIKVEHSGTDIYEVIYHFQDWFDGAERIVEEGSNVWNYAQMMIEQLEEAGA